MPKQLITKSYFVIYDGDCGFCQSTVNFIKKFDWLNKFAFLPFQNEETLKTFNKLTPEMCKKELFLVELQGNIKKYFAGYDAFKIMTLFIPMTMIISWFFFLPGVVQVGRMVYKIIARNRHKIKVGNQSCKIN